MRLTGITVLVVEDDPDNLELLSTHIAAHGGKVLGAGSIAAALAMTVDQSIDVVLSEIELPDGDGCFLLRQLRSRDGGHNLGAIALSSYLDATARRNALGCGFDRYANKPCSLADLTIWFEELTGQSGVHAQSAQSCHAVPRQAARARQAQ